MWPSQIGKTEVLNNAVGYFIAADPSPILVVQPTTEMAESWSKERLAPTIRDTPALAPLIKDPRSRDSGNTTAMKSFPGGNIAVVGANAPSGLAGRPRRVVCLDEVDRYPPSAGTEGDPVLLAVRRTESFWNSVVIMTSTPTVRGLSRIEKEFEQTDKRLWFCPCPECHQFQTLKWAQVSWPPGNPEEARYVCEHCKAELDDAGRVKMIMAGEWRPTAEFRGKRGYHMNGIASPFPPKRGYKSRLHQMVAGFLEAKHGGPQMLKTWVNTFLAETWVDEGEDVEHHPLFERREDYGCEVPDKVVYLTIGIDVQLDRLECEVVGWGADEESWGIFYGRFPGSPDNRETWTELEKTINRTYSKKDGTQLRIGAGLIDTGYATKTVYNWVKNWHVRSIYASKGIAGQGRPVISRFGKASTSKIILFPVGVDSAKEIIYSRLKRTHAGAGYCHFPKSYDEEYFLQLTAERKVRKYVKGFLRIEWEKVRTRNEALDCRVLAQAALGVRMVNLEKMSGQVAKTALESSNSPEGATSQKPENARQTVPLQNRFRPRRPSGWVSGWR